MKGKDYGGGVYFNQNRQGERLKSGIETHLPFLGQKYELILYKSVSTHR